MPINPRRRYNFTAMVPERNAAIARFSKHPELLNTAELQAHSRRVARAQAALDAYLPSINAPRKEVNQKRRRLEATLFYAIVDRDAYAICLHDIDPDTPLPQAMRPVRPYVRGRDRREQIRLSVTRYRTKQLRSDLQTLEFDLACALHDRRQAREACDLRYAAITIAKQEHQMAQAQARMRKPTARAPTAVCKALAAAHAEYRTAYAAWVKANKAVRDFRARIERKQRTIARHDAQFKRHAEQHID